MAVLIGFFTLAYGAESWGYHGIQLGAKITEEQIMHDLGATKYAKNPKFDAWNNAQGCDSNPNRKECKEADFYKYGLNSYEHEEMAVGPYCAEIRPDNFDCVNPEMAAFTPNWVEHGHGVVKVVVFVRHGIVETIDIKFDSIASEDFSDVAHRQLGEDWRIERQSLKIVDATDSKKSIVVERTTQTKKTVRYSAMMTDYDAVLSHVAGPPYQGILEMKLLDQAL